MKRFLKFKQWLLASVLALAASCSFAQIPVTDVAALTQQIQQVTAWAQQYQQMIQQYENQIRQISAMTGGRGMGQLGANMDRQALPADFLSTFDKLRAGSASSGAQAIYDAIKTFSCTEQFPNDVKQRMSCEAITMAAPQNIAVMNTSITSSMQRQQQLKNLLGAVDTTTDTKAAADLANRISVEVALLQNEKQMMDMAVQIQQQQLQLSQTQAAEAGTKRLLTSNDSDGSGNPFNLRKYK